MGKKQPGECWNLLHNSCDLNSAFYASDTGMIMCQHFSAINQRATWKGQFGTGKQLGGGELSTPISAFPILISRFYFVIKKKIDKTKQRELNHGPLDIMHVRCHLCPNGSGSKGAGPLTWCITASAIPCYLRPPLLCCWLGWCYLWTCVMLSQLVGSSTPVLAAIADSGCDLFSAGRTSGSEVPSMLLVRFQHG